ncbi:MAG: HTH domain-containing protein [Candidatus Hydrothermarchaeales archaeon]
MKVISKSKSGPEVGTALQSVIEDMNEELKGADGLISKTECEVAFGPLAVTVTTTVVLNGNSPRHKELIGVNERGVSREHAMRKATEKLNQLLATKNGEIADIFSKTIVTPLPGRVYTTIIASINEDVLEKAHDATIRRQRIKRILQLVDNNPSAINIASVAEIFGVSRTMIYKDLEALGHKRTVRVAGIKAV